jgi:hypothetical protein
VKATTTPDLYARFKALRGRLRRMRSIRAPHATATTNGLGDRFAEVQDAVLQLVLEHRAHRLLAALLEELRCVPRDRLEDRLVEAIAAVKGEAANATGRERARRIERLVSDVAASATRRWTPESIEPIPKFDRRASGDERARLADLRVLHEQVSRELAEVNVAEARVRIWDELLDAVVEAPDGSAIMLRDAFDKLVDAVLAEAYPDLARSAGVSRMESLRNAAASLGCAAYIGK